MATKPKPRWLKKRQVLIKDVLDRYHQYNEGHETFVGFEKLQYEFYDAVERLDQHIQRYGYEE